ncbi:hypothetical protein [Thermoactinomyces mirandus]|uniref:hypothetical protein n=1 Tax=Thermoactinomyces mirandus TaxID=2756294 RepID=UPI0015EF285B|nr:hypothetical protein [Thermoactinomyces mirandus]
MQLVEYSLQINSTFEEDIAVSICQYMEQKRLKLIQDWGGICSKIYGPILFLNQKPLYPLPRILYGKLVDGVTGENKLQFIHPGKLVSTDIGIKKLCFFLKIFHYCKDLF